MLQGNNTRHVDAIMTRVEVMAATFASSGDLALCIKNQLGVLTVLLALLVIHSQQKPFFFLRF
jgi:hypothetical protein